MLKKIGDKGRNVHGEKAARMVGPHQRAAARNPFQATDFRAEPHLDDRTQGRASPSYHGRIPLAGEFPRPAPGVDPTVFDHRAPFGRASLPRSKRGVSPTLSTDGIVAPGHSGTPH